MLATLVSNFAYFKYLVNLYKSFKITSVWISQLFVLFSLSQSMLCLSYAHTYKQIVSETFFVLCLQKFWEQPQLWVHFLPLS